MPEAFAEWTRRRGAPGPGKGVLAALVVLAPIIAWAVALTVNYGAASHACYPADAPRASFLPGWGGLRLVLLAIDVVCLAIAGVGLAMMARDRQSAPHGPESGMPEKHVRLALSTAGLLAVALLFLGVAANGIVLWLILTCAPA